MLKFCVLLSDGETIYRSLSRFVEHLCEIDKVILPVYRLVTHHASKIAFGLFISHYRSMEHIAASPIISSKSEQGQTAPAQPGRRCSAAATCITGASLVNEEN
jgi:hypothetical protein